MLKNVITADRFGEKAVLSKFVRFVISFLLM